ncbi:glycosyltransferase family 4 protein [Olivibacter sitiensis]|uniref:glycosyltransferase family 4 protein n=1 Tax=Olivibacter sitiensis TaxID=376470 RepID=UPI0004180B47|nr:glycosyltransferase family 4 protein [Olivibacter sitiensis]
MKILFINSLYYPNIGGGAEISLQLLAESLQSVGHDVTVLAIDDVEGFKVDYINGIKVFRCGIRNSFWSYRDNNHTKLEWLGWHLRDIYNIPMGRYIKRIIEDENPDIVSVHNLAGWSIAVWDVLNSLNQPFVQVLHDFYLMCNNSNMYSNGHPCDMTCGKCKLLRCLHLHKSKSVNFVVGISRYILDRFMSAGYFTHSTAEVIYNFRKINNNNKICRSDPVNFNVGYIGTLGPFKGIELLIEEFKTLQSKNIRLLVAGSGNKEYENKLRKLSEEDDRISFLGQVESPDFYKKIDVLVVPSLWNEPLGMVAIEGCAFGIPVLTTGYGGLKEIIVDGYNGMFFDPNISGALALAIEKMLNDRDYYNRIQKKARQSVNSFLNNDRLINEYEGFYLKALNQYKR